MLPIRRKQARFAVAQTIALLLVVCVAVAQQKATNSPALSPIDINIFQDDAGHWYGIADKDNMINARPNQPRYKPEQVTEVADNILLYQKDNGGWPKNYDMLAILTDAQKDTLLRAKNLTNTTFDNRTTYSHIATLSRVYSVTKADKYKQAALKGFDFILAAQYANGGWPQYYPLENNYSRCITFNDDAFTGIMWLLKDIVENKPTYDFVDGDRRKLLGNAYNKGLDCILKTQINDAGKPTAWCQQYDEKTLEPAWARKFEPPSICNGESVEIISLLMNIKNPSKQIIAAVQHAVDWFRVSGIAGIRVKTVPAPEMVTPFRISKTDRVVVSDSSAPVIWTRYYELKTHRPVFCNRDSKLVYSLAEVARERRDGYGWYTYGPQKILDSYAAWQAKWVAGK